MPIKYDKAYFVGGEGRRKARKPEKREKNIFIFCFPAAPPEVQIIRTLWLELYSQIRGYNVFLVTPDKIRLSQLKWQVNIIIQHTRILSSGALVLNRYFHFYNNLTRLFRIYGERDRQFY